MRKELRFKGLDGSMGTIGEELEYGFCVGDIVSYLFNDTIHSGVIVKENSNPYIIGFYGTTSLSTMREKYYLAKTIDYTLVNNEVVGLFYDDMEIVEVECEKLTVREIERLLGYKIEIVSDK